MLWLLFPAAFALFVGAAIKYGYKLEDWYWDRLDRQATEAWRRAEAEWDDATPVDGSTPPLQSRDSFPQLSDSNAAIVAELTMRDRVERFRGGH